MLYSKWKPTAPILYSLMIALLFAAFLLLARAHISKNPLRADEVDYYRSMESVVTLGLPLYYAGEVSLRPESLIHLSTRRLGGKQFDFYRFRPETGVFKETFFALTDGASRYTYGMWHPPLYIYLGSLYFRWVPLTPATSWGLRYFNLIFSLGIFAGMIALSRTVYRTRSGLAAVLAALLYTLNGLAVRGAILIDYNATLGPCVATWFAVAYLRSERSRRSYIGLGIMTVLAFLTGLGIGGALLTGVIVYVALTGQIRRVWRALAVVGGGFLAFFPVFLALARLLDLPFSQPFLHNLQRVGARFDLAWLVAQTRAAFEFSVFYSREVGYPMILLGLALFAWLLITRQASHTPTRLFVPILVAVGFLLQGSLRAEAYGFAKYILFLLPLLCVYLAGEVMDRFFVAPVSRWGRFVIGSVFVVVILLQAQNSAEWLQRPGSTLYFVGEQGIESISQQARALTATDETILSSKDVAFFADRKFVQWYGALLSNVTTLQRWVGANHIRVLASNVYLLDAASPEVAAYLARTFPRSVQDGDFRLIYASVTP